MNIHTYDIYMYSYTFIRTHLSNRPGAIVIAVGFMIQAWECLAVYKSSSTALPAYKYMVPSPSHPYSLPSSLSTSLPTSLSPPTIHSEDTIVKDSSIPETVFDASISASSSILS